MFPGKVIQRSAAAKTQGEKTKPGRVGTPTLSKRES